MIPGRSQTSDESDVEDTSFCRGLVLGVDQTDRGTEGGRETQVLVGGVMGP